MSRTHRLDHIERPKIILFSSALKQDKDIAHELGIASRTVRKWRKRWLANEARLLLIVSGEKGSNYIRKILQVLSDNERPGAPCTYTAGHTKEKF